MKEEDKIIMLCLPGQPLATVFNVDGDFIKARCNDKIYFLKKDHVVNGEKELKAIDYFKEIDVPDGVPWEIIKTMVARMEASGDIKHSDIGRDVRSFQFGPTELEPLPDDKRERDVIIEFLRHIKDTTEPTDEYGPKTCLFIMEGRPGIIGLAVPNHQVWESIKSTLEDKKNIEELAFCFTLINADLPKEIQVDDCTHIVKIYYFRHGQWWYCILPYQRTKGSIIWKEENWANDVWTERMQFDIMRANMIPTLDHCPGTAYDDKIKINRYYENSEGYFFEGTIVPEKLDGKLLDFLKNNKLDINNRIGVESFFKEQGMSFSIEKDKFGFFTGRCGKYLFTNKRSKTRTYLEIIESGYKDIN